MELVQEIDLALVNRRVSRRHLCDLLDRARGALRRPLIPEDEVMAPPPQPAYVPEVEQAPVRVRVSNWRYGICKRCLTNDVADGDTVVRIAGKGWWHDACFRVVRPDFYTGI